MSSLRTFWFSLKQTLTYCWSFSSDYVSNLERWLANLNVFYLSIWSNTANKTSRIFLRNYRYNRPKSFKHWIYVLESPHCMFLQWIPKSEQIYQFNVNYFMQCIIILFRLLPVCKVITWPRFVWVKKHDWTVQNVELSGVGLFSHWSTHVMTQKSSFVAHFRCPDLSLS